MQYKLNTKNKKKPRELFNWEPNELDSENFKKFDKVLIHDAFPRQGNTFLSTILNLSFPQNNIAVTGLTHTPLMLGYSLENTETITPTRDPLDCLNSWLVKCNYIKSIEKRHKEAKTSPDEFIKKQIIGYVEVAEAIINREQMHNLTVVNFKFMTEHPEKLVDYVAEKIKVSNYQKLDNSKVVSYLTKRFEFHRENEPEAWSMHGYIPREKSDSYYKIREILNKKDYSEEMSRAYDVHSRLLSLSQLG